MHNQINLRDYNWKLTDSFCESPRTEEKQRIYSDGQLESYQHFSPEHKTQQHSSETAASNSILVLHEDDPRSANVDEKLEVFVSEEIQQSFKAHGHSESKDPKVIQGGDLIDILSDRHKYSSIWHLIHQQLVPSAASMAGFSGAHGVDVKENNGGAENCLEMNDVNLRHDKFNNELKEDYQAVELEKFEFDQNAAVKMVQEALTAILQREERLSDQQSILDHEMPLTPAVEHISSPMTSSAEKFRGSGEVAADGTSFGKEDKLLTSKEGSSTSQKKLETNKEMMSGRLMSKSNSKLRKLIVTANFIKAMERMKKLNSRKPRLLCPEPTTKEERIYLRHWSMKGRKDDEEWMLDYALRQVISSLAPDDQRRVAGLVEAFETVNPEQKEKGFRCYPIKEESSNGIEVNNLISNTPICFIESEKSTSDEHATVQMHDGEVLMPHLCVTEERSLKKASAAGNDAPSKKVLKELDDSESSHSASESYGNKPVSASTDATNEEPVMGDEKSMTSPQFRSQFPTQDSEIISSGDTTTFLFDECKYHSMWSLIYQHVVSSETSEDTEKEVSENDEKKECDQGMKDQDLNQSRNSTDHVKDGDNQTAACEMHELNQSAAIKLVTEAVNAILRHYEQSSDQQFSPDQDKAICDHREYPVKEGECVIEHTCLEPQAKLYQIDRKRELQEQAQPNESKSPEKKFSKSFSKLKKAFVTAKFIKAIERLRKLTPHNSHHLNPGATSGEDRVYLRHMSMDGRKNEEEWMLDYALRQVIFKLAPDQQRTVGRLVEAFESVTPDQKEKSIRCHPTKREPVSATGLSNPTKAVPRQFVAIQQGRSISQERIPQQQDDGLLQSHVDNKMRSWHDDHDNQESTADEPTQHETLKAAVTNSTLDFPEENSKSASVAVPITEPSTEHSIPWGKVEVPSQMERNSEFNIGGDMSTILSDKHKYTSMWHLIYQHAIPSEASTAEKEVPSDDEDEQGNDVNKSQETHVLDTPQSNYRTNQMEDENKQSAASEKQEINQSAAIKLVKEAINAILQSHGPTSNEQSFQDHDTTASEVRDNRTMDAPSSTEKDYRAGKEVEVHINSQSVNKMHTIERACTALLEQTQPIEVASQPSISKSKYKLKKLIMTTKFIKAMERLRRNSSRNLSPETSSEEVVKLRHQNTNQKRSAEEWMLDYALRKVISSLAPDQQKKVARLVEAFEVVNPEQKDNSISSHVKLKPARMESTTNDEQVRFQDEIWTTSKTLIPPKQEDKLNLPGKNDLPQKALPEDHPIEIPNFRTELHGKVLDSDDTDFPIRHEISSKGRRIGETNSNLTETLQQTNSSTEPQHKHDANTANGMFPNAQRHNTMWNLIYQHLTSVTTAETGSELDKRLANEDHMTPRSTLSKIIVDADTGDTDSSSVVSELTESDAIKLVKQAINDILDRRREPDNELISSNMKHASEENQSAEGEKSTIEEKPDKSLTRTHSKLSRLIICNKFIKAMEKTRRSPSYKHNPELNSDVEVEKANLKLRAIGEKKISDDGMLDYALQKVIAGLAPVQQRRVAMLIEAFEKVNPDLEEMNQGSTCVKTKSPNSAVSAGNIKEKQDSNYKSSPKSSILHDGRESKLEEPWVSNREANKGRALVEINEERTTSLRSNECAMSGQDGRNVDPYCTKPAMSDVTQTMSEDDEDVAEVPHRNESVEERSPIEKNLDVYLGKNTAITAKPSQPKYVEGVWTASAETKIYSDTGTSLWNLLVKHINSDGSENMEKQSSSEIDANAYADSANILLQKNNKAPQLFPDVNHDKSMDVCIPKSISFELHEQEAVKLVQEALHEILLPEQPDKTCNDQIISDREISDQDVCSEHHGGGEKPSSAATEISGAERLQSSAVIPQEYNTSAKERLLKSGNDLSKVVLCKRFIKAMDKLRKLKQQSPTDHAQQPHSKAESRLTRQIASSEKKSWEEWMLDHAMQQVVGKLAPAQKKKVSLLVQAFETVSSQPESNTR